MPSKSKRYLDLSLCPFIKDEPDPNRIADLPVGAYFLVGEEVYQIIAHGGLETQSFCVVLKDYTHTSSKYRVLVLDVRNATLHNWGDQRSYDRRIFLRMQAENFSFERKPY